MSRSGEFQLSAIKRSGERPPVATLVAGPAPSLSREGGCWQRRLATPVRSPAVRHKWYVIAGGSGGATAAMLRCWSGDKIAEPGVGSFSGGLAQACVYVAPGDSARDQTPRPHSGLAPGVVLVSGPRLRFLDKFVSLVRWYRREVPCLEATMKDGRDELGLIRPQLVRLTRRPAMKHYTTDVDRRGTRNEGAAIH